MRRMGLWGSKQKLGFGFGDPIWAWLFRVICRVSKKRA